MTEIRVLMVCMGNICRSPMAEAVLRHKLEEAGVADRVLVDSAGTHSYHLGEPPHPETQAELARRGVDVGDQTSRLVTSADLDEFDFVFAMDRANLANLRELAHPAGGIDEVRAEVSLLLGDAEVPDPYYEGGYERVFELVDAGCGELLERIVDRVTAEARP